MNTEEFKKKYSQFSEQPDELIQSHLDDFLLLYSDYAFKQFKDMAQGLYAAHNMTIDLANPITSENISDGFSSGVVQMERTPEFAISYAVSSKTTSKSYFDKTIFGQRFIDLLQKITPLSILC